MKNFLELIASLFGKGALSRVMGTRTNVVRFPNQESQRLLTKDLNIEAASDAAVKQAYKYAEELFPSYPQMNDAEKLIFEGNLRRLDNAITDRGIKIKELEETQLPSAQLRNLQKRLDQARQSLEEQAKISGKPKNLSDLIDDYFKLPPFRDIEKTKQIENEALVRAVARSIMFNDIKSGKLKVPDDIRKIVSGESSQDVLDPFRRIYGEDALEQLDSLSLEFKQLNTSQAAEDLARSKFTFEPDVNRPPGSYTREEEIESNVVPFKKKPDEPEKFAMGGNVESKGLDYLMGLSRPYATGGRVGFDSGGGKFKKVKDIENLIRKLNKKLSKKKSMESMNPKTGELTIPEKPVTTADKIKRKPTKEEYDEYSEILDDSENFVVQGNETFEELDALVKKQKDYEDYMYMQYKMGKLDPAPGEKTQNRLNFLRKKAEEAEIAGDRRLFTLDEMEELEDLEKIFEPSSIDISDPKVVESFTEFARQNDPEGFKKIQKIVDDINNKNALDNFDITGRKPNASGGLNYLMGL